MPAPIAAAAALAARFAARKLANDAAKKSAKKAVARKSATVRVKPKTTASGPGLETRGNKITAESQKAAAKKLIQEDRSRTINSPSMNYIDSTFRGPSLKTINRNKPVKRAAEKKLPIKINTDPTKPKGVFGPLKKKVEAANTPANRAKAKANARGLKAANKPTRSSKSKLTMREKAGKAVVNATIGKTAARKYAASKLRKSK